MFDMQVEKTYVALVLPGKVGRPEIFDSLPTFQNKQKQEEKEKETFIYEEYEKYETQVLTGQTKKSISKLSNKVGLLNILHSGNEIVKKERKKEFKQNYRKKSRSGY